MPDPLAPTDAHERMIDAMEREKLRTRVEDLEQEARELRDEKLRLEQQVLTLRKLNADLVEANARQATTITRMETENSHQGEQIRALKDRNAELEHNEIHYRRKLQQAGVEG